MSDVTPPSGDLPPPPPGPPGPGFWQQSSTPLHEPAPERPPTYVTPPGLQQPLGAAPGPSVPDVAGFWRRAWARGITLLFWLLVLDVGTYLIALLFLFIYSATPNDSILLAGLAVSWAYGLLVTYLIWSRSLATRRGTLGMRQMGLSIRSASRQPAISKGQAFRRSIIALLPFVFASGAGWLFLYSPDDDLIVLSLIVQAALVGLVTLGGLWMLVSPRRQTVWDIVGDTVVVVDREPSWLAVSALVAGLLVPTGSMVSLVVVGAARLQSEYRSLSGYGSAGRYFLYNIPTLVLSVIAIALGHVAIRATRWEAQRLAGRGLARTALFLGYLFPVAFVATLAFGAIYRQVEDLQVRSCSDTRDDIAVAAESYRLLNGTYPDSIAPMTDGIYLDDPELAERWTLSDESVSGAPEYRLTGKGDCAKA